MIEGIKIAVTSYKDSEESANLAAQISFFIAKERKNQVFLIVNTEYDLIDKMRGRTELNDVTFCKGEVLYANVPPVLRYTSYLRKVCGQSQ